MTTETEEEKQESLITHLIELRNRLIKIIIGIVVVVLCLFPFANDIYSFLAEPLLKHLPESSTMVAIDVASPFLTPFKLVMLLAVVVTIPWILYQLWAFIAPGLYKHEKRLVLPLLASSSLLFYLGMAFAYFVVFPLVFGFFTKVTPDGVAVMTDISRYLDFVTKLFIAFGAAFEVPVITFVLIMTGVTTVEALSAARSYVIVAAFVIGMLLTPPDIISQVLLAIPVWLLFELGLIMSKIFNKRRGPEDRRFRPMTDEEMDIELDEIELLESEPENKINKP
ncbi:MAG: twin-arginine translocase subunit TatC [Gammaproteobacteria bacterium]|nr:twin-arginine translocase subunit TatC [Gammaproteobacteria bacterium]